MTGTAQESCTEVSEEEKNNDTTSFGISDQSFADMMSEELKQHPLAADYPEIFCAAPKCLIKWRQRYRGNPALWKRLFDKDRVLKEIIEAVPVIDAVKRYVEFTNNPEPFMIVDLCSGKGFLSMMLSELLPPSKVRQFLLVDKAWPCHGFDPQPYHISWEHIYGKAPDADSSSYYESWPIPLTTTKVDLKSGRQQRDFQKRFLQDGPVILLAIHLCGTLSLQALHLFNNNSTVQFFCLKPCCLPGIVHAKRHEIFEVGQHSFDSKLVCEKGKWNKGKWRGPPRSDMAKTFNAWTENLFLGIDNNSARKGHVDVRVQHQGGYQNDFLFAERPVLTGQVWESLDAKAKVTKEQPT